MMSFLLLFSRDESFPVISGLLTKYLQIVCEIWSKQLENEGIWAL